MIIHDIDEGYLPAGFRVEYRHGKFHVSTIGGAEHVTLNESSHSVGNSLQLQNGILIEHFPNARFLEGRNNHGNVRLWRFVEKEWLETHRGELESLRGVADELGVIAAMAQITATVMLTKQKSLRRVSTMRMRALKKPTVADCNRNTTDDAFCANGATGAMKGMASET